MKINERDKMTFPELWLTLTLAETKAVRKNITRGLRKTTPTFWRWYKGEATPDSYAEKALFALIINETLDMDTDADTLFPDKKQTQLP